jgi:tetraacyldisaccharide 4'-kinase
LSTGSQQLQQAWLQRGALGRALWPLSRLFGLLVGARRLLYRSGLRPAETVGLPVVVVGNRIVGGAGKTPVVMALVEHLRSRGLRPGVISRGYGRRTQGVLEATRDRTAGEVGDEPLLIHLRTGAPVVVGRDRTAAAWALRTAHPEIDVIVCDDGLQHLRLGRDIEVVVFDDRGAGNGWLLPAGPLREPLRAASLAKHQIVLYTGGVASTPLPGFLAKRGLGGVLPLAQWWDATPPADLRQLAGRAVLAVAGIARPERFFESLTQAGLHITPLALPDHHGFEQLPWPTGTIDVVVTEKDAIKLDPARVARETPATQVWVATLDFQPDPEFFGAVDRALQDIGALAH